ncbi:hypothetical protein [Hymenobacter bucti]|uniref:DUF4199 domain-containing protein n=1 Tax=Hymenobacter bucti TaxID=1844114 RepID=A0ABW4QTP0_9BACT
MKLRLSEEQLQQQVRYFAYYQLVGGFITAGIILLALARVESLSGILFLAYVAFLGLAGFAIYCGYLCLKQPTRVRGLQLSRFSLLLQLFGFAAGGFSFRFFAGPFIALSIDLTNEVLFKADASLAEFSFKIGHDSDALLLSVNVAAMFLFFRTTFWLNEWRTRYGSSEPATTSD